MHINIHIHSIYLAPPPPKSRGPLVSGAGLLPCAGRSLAFEHVYMYMYIRTYIAISVPKKGAPTCHSKAATCSRTNIPTHGKASTCYPRTYAQQGSDLHGTPVAVPELNKEGVLQVGDGSWPTLRHSFGGRRSSQRVLLLPPGPSGMREGTHDSLGECQS